MKYILPLDGFRALAIALVFIFHLNETFLPGGFIGVDIFFVISGFIITKMLISQHENQAFSFTIFYQRRVARLLPAVIVTVVVSLIAAWFVYGQAQLTSFAETGLYSIASVVNIYFYFHSGYFDTGSQTNIFLHNWSLSVEEQFYLVWPLLLFFLMKFRQHLALSMGVIALVTAILSWIYASIDPNGAFFLMPARIFQFAAGGFVGALFSNYKQEVRISNLNFVKSFAFPIGMVMILSSAWFSGGEDYRFLVAALLPTIGATLVLFSIHSNFSNVVFSNKIARAIGIRAYAIYLVHWPIIVMTKVFYPASPVIYYVIVLALTVVLAMLLHRFVEKPFRISRSIKFTTVNLPTESDISFLHLERRKFLVVAGMAVASLVGVSTLWNHSQPSLTPTEIATTDNSPVKAVVLTSKDARNIDIPYTEYVTALWTERYRKGPGRFGCQPSKERDFSTFFQKKFCTPVREEKNSVFIIGDSYAVEVYFMLTQVVSEERILMAGAGGCMPLYPEPISSKRSKLCQEVNAFRFERAKDDDVEAIFLTSNWDRWDEEQMRSTLAYLVSLEKPIYIIGARPLFTEKIPVLLDSARGKVIADDLMPYMKYKIYKQSELLRKVADEFDAPVQVINILNFLCPEKCSAFTSDGTLIYLDVTHISPESARQIGRYIKKVYAKDLAVLKP